MEQEEEEEEDEEQGVVAPISGGKQAEQEETPRAKESEVGDVDSTTGIFDDLERRLECLEVDYVNQVKETERRQSQHLELEKRNGLLEEDKGNLTADIERLEGEAGMLQQGRAEMEVEIGNLQAEITATTNSQREERSQSTQTEQRLRDEAQAQEDRLNSMIQEMSIQLAESSKEVVVLRPSTWVIARLRRYPTAANNDNDAAAMVRTQGNKVFVTHHGQDQQRPSSSASRASAMSKVSSSNMASGAETSHTFDRVISQDGSNTEICRHLRPMIQAVLDGTSVFMFADGPSGSGKTFTMFKAEDSVAWAVGSQLCEWLRQVETDPTLPARRASCWAMEDYTDEYRDLLANRTVVKVNDHKSIEIESMESFTQCLEDARGHRRVSRTHQNTQSSRGHLAFMIEVTDGSKSSKLGLIDLAGNEDLASPDSQSEKLQKEHKAINKSRLSWRTALLEASEGTRASVRNCKVSLQSVHATTPMMAGY